MNKKIIVTTGRKDNELNLELAKNAASCLNAPLVEREKAGISALKEKYGADLVLVAKKNELILETLGGELFFHPNMAHLRLKNLRLGTGDRMVEAMGLSEGMSVLDCTLGFGADAIVASFAVGENGKVVGIERVPVIELIVRQGLANFTDDNERIIAAMRRIKTINADALDFLRQQGDNSFDVVYFDPMFRHPFLDSKSLNPLREVADKRALTIEYINEARRVAKRRVVMKESSLSTEFTRLGFNRIAGGKYSKISYGIIEKYTAGN